MADKLADVEQILHKDATPYAAVQRLQTLLPQIKSIYCIVESHDGDSEPIVLGDREGLAHAILMLQKQAMDSFDEE